MSIDAKEQGKISVGRVNRRSNKHNPSPSLSALVMTSSNVPPHMFAPLALIGDSTTPAFPRLLHASAASHDYASAYGEHRPLPEGGGLTLMRSDGETGVTSHGSSCRKPAHGFAELGFPP